MSISSNTTTSTTLPKRPVQKKQNRLGPYNLLQTLGEGEFGKVKLGIHTETGQEVKIIFYLPFFSFVIKHVFIIIMIIGGNQTY
jgi:serine/threonine protein kinase